MSNYTGRRDASRGGAGSKTSAYTGQFDDDDDDDLSKQN